MGNIVCIYDNKVKTIVDDLNKIVGMLNKYQNTFKAKDVKEMNETFQGLAKAFYSSVDEVKAPEGKMHQRALSKDFYKQAYENNFDVAEDMKNAGYGFMEKANENNRVLCEALRDLFVSYSNRINQA